MRFFLAFTHHFNVLQKFSAYVCTYLMHVYLDLWYVFARISLSCHPVKYGSGLLIVLFSSPWSSLSGMKPEFSSYGYPGAPPSHLHPPYSPLSPLPVKSDLLTQSYQQYAAASQFGELIYIYRIGYNRISIWRGILRLTLVSQSVSQLVRQRVSLWVGPSLNYIFYYFYYIIKFS